jgi:hypothetical protein
MGLELMLGPLARRLETLDGRRYLRLCGQLPNHPRYVADTRDMLFVADGVARCTVYVSPLLDHLPERVRAERVRQLVGFTVRSVADQAALVDAANPPRTPLPTDEFATNLVDTVVAMLAAESSLR